MSAAHSSEPLFPAPLTIAAGQPLPLHEPQNGSGRSFFDLAIVVLGHRRLLFGLTALATAAAGVIAFLLPNEYTAEVLLLPPESAQSSAQVLLGQLSPLVTLAGGTTLKSPVEMYGALAASHAIEGALVDRFDLKKVYGRRYAVEAMADLESVTKIQPMLKEGMLKITVVDEDPKRAAALADGYADELAAATTRMTVHDGQVRQQFYSEQLKKARQEISLAEQQLQQVQKQTGILDLGAETRVSIEMVANLRAQIAAHEVQLASISSWATPDNPQRLAIEQQLGTLRGQLARAADGQPSLENGMPKLGVAEHGADYLRAYRELTYQEALNEALERQYEAARMDASRISSVVQVLSPAVVPEQKSGPHRTIIVLATLLLSFGLVSCGILIAEALRSSLSTPAVQARWTEIGALLGLRKRVESGARA